MMYSETIRGTVYKPKCQIPHEFGLSKSTVDERVKEIREEIKIGRYDDRSIMDDGNIVLVNVLVFMDYIKYRRQLKEKNARKHVPEFQPEKWVWISGWNDRIITVGGNENERIRTDR